MISKFARRVKCRLDEKLNGEYDIQGMMKEAPNLDQAVPNLDHADYTGPVRQGDGKGLWATKSIPAGTLLLCTKAYAVLFGSTDTLHLPVVKKRHTTAKYIRCLVARVLEKLQRRPETAIELKSLYAAAGIQPQEQIILQEDEGRKPRFDLRIVSKIVSRCCLRREFQFPSDGYKIEAGLWILPSLINHSCLGNARYYSIGDFMFVRAISDISEGQEILVSFVDPLIPFEHRTMMLQKRGIVCHCSLCSSARKRPAAVQHFRSELIREFRGIERRAQMGDYTTIPHVQLKNIISRLRSSVDVEGDTPLELIGPLMVLTYHHTSASHFNKAVHSLLELLECIPRVGADSYNMRYETSCHLRVAYILLGQVKAAKNWENMAREEYYIMNGHHAILWQNYLLEFDAAHLRHLLKALRVDLI